MMNAGITALPACAAVFGVSIVLLVAFRIARVFGKPLEEIVSYDVECG